MNKRKKSIDKLVESLRERAKELNCLYQVEELTNKSDIEIEEVFKGIIKAIPPGWQFPDVCKAKIEFKDSVYQSPDFEESEWVQSADIIVQDEKMGKISVYYTEKTPAMDIGPFLKEEQKLLQTIADRIGHFILHHRLRDVFQKGGKIEKPKEEWWTIIELLKGTDQQLLLQISRKMANFLCWSGIKEAEKLLEHFGPAYANIDDEIDDNINRPFEKTESGDFLSISEDIFKIAGDHLSENEILSHIQKWIKEDKSNFLVNILEHPASSLPDIAKALEQYHLLSSQGLEVLEPREKAFRVALIRRFLIDHPDFINIAKQFIGINDFYELLKRVVYPPDSHGKLGGKSSGLILANQILKHAANQNELLGNIKMPKTWFIPSDGILNFMHYNNLEDVMEQKYKDIEQVRKEYPYILQVFKNSRMSPEIANNLMLALDDFGDSPLIVRSSSLLEDQMGTAFAGKYKSLFIANRGTREEKLAALMDAISEVYASIFSPDPIEYRSERGMQDLHEEMGILIQEVVGEKVGKYFIPAFAGVAFSNNEFRWSSRIKPENGLVRIVPGLGTRAVDRLSDDYPILVSPGQPGLKVNVSVDEIIKYSPRKIDVINLETNQFETITIHDLFKEYGHEYPEITNIVSIFKHQLLQQPMGIGIDFDHDNPVVTFEGLFNRTPFLKQILVILKTLQDKLRTPVDIEFAHDGQNFYLLQCRPQSYSKEATPANIPKHIPENNIIFSAHRYISNGTIENITHVVFVDPDQYYALGKHSDLRAVGRVVSQLNKYLPKRQFVLIGPGRWGSRGDIKLGVNVTYSDINNAAMLIEVAQQKGNYLPELSFGTHFFQDLVESSIRYLPIYPDDPKIQFKENFFSASKNILSDILPEFSYLTNTIKVIDIPKTTNGMVLNIYMNSEVEEAIGILSEPTAVLDATQPKKDLPKVTRVEKRDEDELWRWRLSMAEQIALKMDPERFGVKEFYVFGSTKNATARPVSDIDLLIHFAGTEKQRAELLNWLEGWSLCLSEINYLRTGYKTKGLLDVHLVSEDDIKNKRSFAVKIGAITDPARPLPMGSRIRSGEKSTSAAKIEK
jgi:pyruvate,water dikinase